MPVMAALADWRASEREAGLKDSCLADNNAQVRTYYQQRLKSLIVHVDMFEMTRSAGYCRSRVPKCLQEQLLLRSE